MVDNKEKKVTIKAQKEKDIKVGGEEYQVKWEKQDVTFDKAEEGGIGITKLNVLVKKKADANWPTATVGVTIKYAKGFWSHGAKLEKGNTELVSSKTLDADLSLGVKGFKTQGIVTMIVIAIALLGLLIGLWYWMTRKSPEDEE